MNRKKTITNNEISTVKTYNLNGFAQKVLLEGKSRTLPLLVFLHGGPGFPLPFSVGSRGMEKEITDQYIFVCWDQLGCGANNYMISDDFTIDDYVLMTRDLLTHLKRDFPDNSIHIFGVSWGSVLAAKVVESTPELVDYVTIYGQFLKESAFSEEVYDLLSKTNLPEKKKIQLESIFKKQVPTMTDYKSILRWLRKYTDAYHYKKSKRISLLPVIYGYLTSPDYRLRDFYAVLFNGFNKNNSILQELQVLDLSDTLENINIPYHIMQGEADVNTSTNAVKQFLETSNNSNLTLQVINKSSHMPSKDAFSQIINTLIKNK